LVFLFAGWILKSKRNYMIILYIISFSLVSVNLVVSLLYLESYFSSSAALPEVRPYPIVSYVTNAPAPSSAESLSTAFDALSLSSFLLMWIATAIFLSQYRHKMGRIKYFSLMSIPLIYYIFPLQGYFGDVFFNLLQSSPVSYSIIYILIFSATKQVGAVLFSLAFWTASTIVYDNRIRKSLLLSAIGMAILYGTFEIAPLQYHVYPPYGFITQAFIPLGAYLLFVGIFSSAKVISRDSTVRKEFYKSASSQLSLLKTIGVSQMEKELEKEVKSVEEKLSKLSPETTVDIPQLEEQEVKEILHDVLNELYYSKGKR
jgi:ABC-type multidrug transport system fused ATPase/permease subunit